MKTYQLATDAEGSPEADDFKRIPGIGPVIERHLHEAGVCRFAQLAALTPEQIAAIVAHLPLLSAERIIRQNWVGRARDLAREAAAGRADPTYPPLAHSAADEPGERRAADPSRGGMEQDEPREVAHRRRPEPAPESVGAAAKLIGVSAHLQAALAGIDDPDDDLAVSNLAYDFDARMSTAPSYGEMEAPPRLVGDLTLEPVGGLGMTANPRSAEPAARPGNAPLLDAWFASFGHPALVDLLLRPEAAATLAQLGADSDERAQVTKTEDYPWRCICALTITAADGSRWLGTGWLAGPHMVITAGHCLYMPTRGGWVRQVEVAPGRNGSQQPYGSCLATSFRSVRGWIYRQRPSHNYGAIMLPADRALGNLLGHLGYLNLSDRDLSDLEVNLAGYPGDKPRGTLWYTARRLRLAMARGFEYPVTTLGGESGAPLWRLQDGRRYVVGIHTGGDQAGNSAVRLSAPVFANLGAWRRDV